MDEVQSNRYQTFLKSKPPMDSKTAKLAATTHKPCFCIISLNGQLVQQGMQCNDIAVLFKYSHTNGYSVQIFPASLDFKLSQEEWRIVKEILEKLR